MEDRGSPLLFRAGLSLENSRLSEAAIAYWQSISATSTRLLGPAHANAVVARDRLAGAPCKAAGRPAEAISVFAAALADRERNQGPEHPETIAARGHLAHAYTSAGRAGEAVALYERTVADSERSLGPGHAVTLSSRARLAAAYQSAGQIREAVSAYELLLTDSEQLLGPGHPTTLGAAGQPGRCLRGQRPGQGRHLPVRADPGGPGAALGREHPDVIAARAALASAYRSAGKMKDAIGQYERVLGDRERVEGADHPDTIAARANLAYAYRSAGRLREAVPVTSARSPTGSGSRERITGTP